MAGVGFRVIEELNELASDVGVKARIKLIHDQDSSSLECVVDRSEQFDHPLGPVRLLFQIPFDLLIGAGNRRVVRTSTLCAFKILSVRYSLHDLGPRPGMQVVLVELALLGEEPANARVCCLENAREPFAELRVAEELAPGICHRADILRQHAEIATEPTVDGCDLSVVPLCRDGEKRIVPGPVG